MGVPLRVLIIEESADNVLLLLQKLRDGGYAPECRQVNNADGMAAALAEREWDIVIADYLLPRFGGMAALELLQQQGLDLPFIIVSDRIGEETAVEAVKSGAHD
jgi:DNA-binding NtrC family response regulator